MRFSSLNEILFGEQAKLRYLFFAAAILLFMLLASRDIWTQEHRWADIVANMFLRQDFLHPYLGKYAYYDKPLLSYWFVAFFAKIMGTLNLWALRLPSAIAGLIALFSIYQIGTHLKNKQLGILAAWILLTTYYFVFWARTSSADMLNVGGSLAAIAWYISKREQISFHNYFIFFLIVSLTSLCKGITVVPFIAVAVDLTLQKTWRKHLNIKFLSALFCGLLIYCLPFIASTYFNSQYDQNGLYLVYRENVLRYFEPFDHRDPIYIYFIYLPVYFLPWAFLFIPAIFSSFKKNFQQIAWVNWTLFCCFLFFTLSGSRRSYYVLPIVPFAALFTANWILSSPLPYLKSLTAKLIVMSTVLLLFLIILLPAWYYQYFGAYQFSETIKKEAQKSYALHEWQIITLDADSKFDFYFKLNPMTQHYEFQGKRIEQTQAHLSKIWPILNNKPPHTIFLSRQANKALLRDFFSGYRLIEMPAPPFLANEKKKDLAIAFMPT